jgi:hypothetical protein
MRLLMRARSSLHVLEEFVRERLHDQSHTGLACGVGFFNPKRY